MERERPLERRGKRIPFSCRDFGMNQEQCLPAGQSPATTQPLHRQLFLCRRLVLGNGRWCGGRRRRGLRLCLRGLYSGEHRCRPGSARRKNRKRDRREHENDRGPGCGTGKNRCRAPRAKCRLAALTSESGSQVATLSTLEQHDRNQEKANDNVNHYDQNGHGKQNSVRARARFKFRSSLTDRVGDSRESG